MDRPLAPAVPMNPSLSLLLVEDHEDEALLLQAELRARGVPADIVRVDCRQDMVAALQRADWDLIICDHSMPGFDSRGALEVLKQSGRDIPFIIYSGYISPEQAVSAMHEGVCDFIDKGNVERLIPVIQRELKGAQARRAVRQADLQIHALANYDTLLDLPNRDLFCRQVDRLLTGATRPPLLVYLDLDRFLRINGSFGFSVGNEILRQVAERLHRWRGDALLARAGGDKFSLYLPSLGEGGLPGCLQSLMGLFARPFHKERLELYLTASIGIVSDTLGATATELMTRAEAACDEAKRSGGNSYRVFDPSMTSGGTQRLALEADLRHALARDELFIAYQPIVEVHGGRVASVEALLRWQHPVHGVIGPDRFIPLADESGLIVEIGGWVLNQACRQTRAWHEQGHSHLAVAVNVSPVQFAEPRLLEQVSEALQASGLPPDSLELEITEATLMREAESTRSMLRTLKGLGVKISADDFGTGYSNLSYLKRFPIDILKIDKSFTRDLGQDRDDDAIVNAILAMARSLGLGTIAEGVETPAQAEWLRQAQCDRLQGHFYADPRRAESLDMLRIAA